MPVTNGRAKWSTSSQVSSQLWLEDDLATFAGSLQLLLPPPPPPTDPSLSFIYLEVSSPRENTKGESWNLQSGRKSGEPPVCIPQK